MFDRRIVINHINMLRDITTDSGRFMIENTLINTKKGSVGGSGILTALRKNPIADSCTTEVILVIWMVRTAPENPFPLPGGQITIPLTQQVASKLGAGQTLTDERPPRKKLVRSGSNNRTWIPDRRL